MCNYANVNILIRVLENLCFISVGPKEKYFLLTNYLPEDLEIRKKLNNEKLVREFIQPY